MSKEIPLTKGGINVVKETLFAHYLCNQLAEVAKGYREMRDFYLFRDKRPGSIVERFELDARSYFEYQKMFQG
jgi:hypothetical protein